MNQNSKKTTITINLSDEQKILAMKAVLAYEAGTRGLSVSQTIVDMVMESADIESYPEDVRAELEGLYERRSRRAARRCLDVATSLARSA